MAEAATTPESDLDRPWNEIGDLGLQTYIADLDAHGYTVIPPEIASPNGLAERMLEACLDIAKRRNGERPDLGPGSSRMPTTTGDGGSPVGDVMKLMFIPPRCPTRSTLTRGART